MSKRNKERRKKYKEEAEAGKRRLKAKKPAQLFSSLAEDDKEVVLSSIDKYLALVKARKALTRHPFGWH